MVTASIAEIKVTALETAGARRKRVKNPELPTTRRRAMAAVGATSAGVRSTLRSEDHLAHRHCGLCKSLEHRTRDCEERGAEKGAMLAKLTGPAVSEESLVFKFCPVKDCFQLQAQGGSRVRRWL